MLQYYPGDSMLIILSWRPKGGRAWHHAPPKNAPVQKYSGKFVAFFRRKSYAFSAEMEDLCLHRKNYRLIETGP